MVLVFFRYQEITVIVFIHIIINKHKTNLVRNENSFEIMLPEHYLTILYFTFLFTLFVFVSKPVQYRYYIEQKMKPLHLLIILLFQSLPQCMCILVLCLVLMCLLESKLQWSYLDFHFFYFSDCFSICVRNVHIMYDLCFWLKWFWSVVYNIANSSWY